MLAFRFDMSRTNTIIASILALVTGLLLGHRVASPAAAEHDVQADEAGELTATGEEAAAIPTGDAPSQEAPDAPADPSPAPKPNPSAEDVYDLPIPGDAPTLGANRNPKVVMQVFSDFQCPACSRVVPLVEEVRKNHGDDVKVVFRHYPLEMHRNAMQAHEAALEVRRQGGDAKFWAYHDILFENQRALTVDNLVRWADELGGIDGDGVAKALETHRHRPRIEKDMKALDDTGVRIGTPMLSINGRLIRGVMEYSAFKNVLRRAMPE